MGSIRDSLRPGVENLFDVIAIGLNSEGKWAICRASGSSTSVSAPPYYVLHTVPGRMQNVSREGCSKNGARDIHSRITGVLLCAWKSGHWGSGLMRWTVVHTLHSFPNDSPTSTTFTADVHFYQFALSITESEGDPCWVGMLAPIFVVRFHG